MMEVSIHPMTAGPGWTVLFDQKPDCTLFVSTSLSGKERNQPYSQSNKVNLKLNVRYFQFNLCYLHSNKKQ